MSTCNVSCLRKNNAIVFFLNDRKRCYVREETSRPIAPTFEGTVSIKNNKPVHAEIKKLPQKEVS